MPASAHLPRAGDPRISRRYADHVINQWTGSDSAAIRPRVNYLVPVVADEPPSGCTKQCYTKLYKCTQLSTIRTFLQFLTASRFGWQRGTPRFATTATGNQARFCTVGPRRHSKVAN